MKQHTPAQLRHTLHYEGPRELWVAWAEQVVFGLFSLNQQGNPIPAALQIEQQTLMIFRLEQAQVDELIATWHADEKHLHARALPFWQLARLALDAGCPLVWQEQQLRIDEGPLAVLGSMVLTVDDDDYETFVSITPLPLQGPGISQHADAILQAWQWIPTTAVSPDETSDTLVYDDRLPWHDNPLMPSLPDNAQPRSALTVSQRQAFDRFATPPLPVVPLVNGPEAQALEESKIVDSMSGYEAISDELDAQLFPFSDRLKLEVCAVADPEHNASSVAGTCAYQQIKIVYIELNAATPLLFWQARLSLEDLKQLPFALPLSPGFYPLPQELWQRFYRYLCWELVQYSQKVVETSFTMPRQLPGLVSLRLKNTDADFFADFTDARYPYLASLHDMDGARPVMVIGEQASNLVVVPLEKGASIPSSVLLTQPEAKHHNERQQPSNEQAPALWVPASSITALDEGKCRVTLSPAWVVKQARAGLDAHHKIKRIEDLHSSQYPETANIIERVLITVLVVCILLGLLATVN